PERRALMKRRFETHLVGPSLQLRGERPRRELIVTDKNLVAAFLVIETSDPIVEQKGRPRFADYPNVTSLAQHFLGDRRDLHDAVFKWCGAAQRAQQIRFFKVGRSHS